MGRHRWSASWRLASSPGRRLCVSPVGRSGGRSATPGGVVRARLGTEAPEPPGGADRPLRAGTTGGCHSCRGSWDRCRTAAASPRRTEGSRHARGQTEADHRGPADPRAVIDGCTQALRDLDHVRQVVAETCFRTEPSAPVPGRVGLEVESFPVRVLADGTPRGRVPLDLLADLLQPESGASSVPGCRRSDGATPRFRLDGGGSLSFEPGGQLEHSTAIHAGAADALAELDLVARALTPLLRRHDMVLAAAGADVWLRGGHVPQQLRAPRYPAMAAYFDRRGPEGAAMMRRTCALQINLDLGGAGDLPERWLVANLVAPLLCATFACSPGPGAVSVRALAWQRLDPTRTGFPRRLLDGSGAGPVEQLTVAAMAADVLLLRHPSGPWEPGTPGWAVQHWLRDGHPRHGRPTEDDLRYHLTTLFLEVRP